MTQNEDDLREIGKLMKKNKFRSREDLEIEGKRIEKIDGQFQIVDQNDEEEP